MPASRRAAGVALALAAVVAGTASAADDEAAQMALGKTLFTVGAVPPCATCHTLKDAGATGAIGPVLDELQPPAERVVAAMLNGIGAMPSFRGSLSDEQMRALARYVSKASGGAR
jgi:sulfite dehydrogenase